MAQRQTFKQRVIDNGDGTGTLEIQLDGSGILSLSGEIRKEAWDGTIPANLEPGSDVVEGQGNTTVAAPVKPTPVSRPIRKTAKKTAKRKR